MEIVSDKALLQKVNQRLTRMGSQSSVTATIRSGEVTLTGMLPFEIQRQALLKAAGSVGGVRRVIDQLKVVVKKKVY